MTLENILSPKPRIDFTVESAPNWQKFQTVIDKINEIDVGLEEHAKRDNKGKILAAMANVPDVEPLDARNRIPEHM